MVVDEDREGIVGFTLVGADVAELLHAATIAITTRPPTGSGTPCRPSPRHCELIDLPGRRPCD
jgi:hypothetical protein